MFAKYFILIFVIKVTSGLYVDDTCTLNHDRSSGICKLDNACPIVQNLLQCRRIRPTVCGFEGSRPIVCCPTNPVNLGNCGANNQLGNVVERISVRKCKEYKRCGSNLRRKKRQYGIVGGTEALVGQYPHMAVIGWLMNDGSGYAWNCGGSLVSERWVLTAAHCTYVTDSRNFQSAEPNIVRLGEHNLKSPDETVTQDIGIERIVRHPQYQAPLKYHDIGLIRLRNNAVFATNVRPICLWQTENISTNKSLATGWGRVGYIEDPSDFLQAVTIDIFNQNICQDSYKDRKRFLPNGIIKQQLCAGDLDGGKDTCQGDSGGPLQIVDPDLYCAYHLIGITSFGVGCGGPNSPAVYTRVSSYIDWIESIVWPN